MRPALLALVPRSPSNRFPLLRHRANLPHGRGRRFGSFPGMDACGEPRFRRQGITGCKSRKSSARSGRPAGSRWATPSGSVRRPRASTTARRCRCASCGFRRRRGISRPSTRRRPRWLTAGSTCRGPARSTRGVLPGIRWGAVTMRWTRKRSLRRSGDVVRGSSREQDVCSATRRDPASGLEATPPPPRPSLSTPFETAREQLTSGTGPIGGTGSIGGDRLERAIG